ncbi:protein kinase-like domain-containing protein [Artemisia annua]|uniref:non-specific serine/threonine protein kinase n=1 Tax=Artemisia annua TaxID=35608 RepID=A0A2U1MYM6_ARTAN|nr:protein kinase-like domain-containing protein [Artemisia annua]
MSLPLLVFLSLCFFITTIAAAQTNISAFKNCAPSDCKGLNISYPFWKIDDQTRSQYCGYEGLGINCSSSTISGEDRPMMYFGGNSYYVRNLTNTSVTLVDDDVFSIFPVQNECSRVKHRIQLERPPLDFMSNTVNLSFHFNCTGVIPDFATEIRCLNRGPKRSCVNVMHPGTENYDWRELACDDEVVTTVLDLELFLSNNLLNTRVIEALGTGFELSWRTTTDDCNKCEESDGACGHNNSTGFMCFCANGTWTRNDCKGTTSLIQLFNLVVTYHVLMC